MQKHNIKYTLLFLFSMFAVTGLIASQHMFANAPSTADQYTLTIHLDSSQCTQHDTDHEDHDACAVNHPSSILVQHHNRALLKQQHKGYAVVRVAQQRAPPYFS